MQDLNANLDPKLLDEGTTREREPEIKKTCRALDEMESQLRSLHDENSCLRDELLCKERQLAEARKISVDDTCKAKEFEDEIWRLNLLLAERGVMNNHGPVSPAKRIPARELECCRKDMPISGNGGSGSCVYHMLAEYLVGMKISLKNEMEGFSLSIYHEASGYSFTLSWLEEANGGEWVYKCSSLGTIERIALEWMREQDIRFSMNMCPVFFKQICGVTRYV